MAVLVSIPAHERDVFGRDFNEASAGFNETTSQQATEAESARVVSLKALLWFQIEIESLGGGRIHETMGAIERFEKLFFLGIEAGGGALCFLSLHEELIALLKALARHARGRTAPVEPLRARRDVQRG